MQEVITALASLVEEWRKESVIPEVDWTKMRAIEFQEAIGRRAALRKKLESMACTLCQDFDDHVSDIGSALEHSKLTTPS
jgi:antiviral helicase SKI2